MRISCMRLKNIRGFEDTGKIEFSQNINLFIGWNNSGKSTFLRGIYQLQKALLGPQDITIGQELGQIFILATDEAPFFQSRGGQINPPNQSDDVGYNLVFDFQRNQGIRSARYLGRGTSIWHLVEYIPSDEPKNLIYPFLSRRKVISYSEQVDVSVSNKVLDNLENIAAKVDRLANSESPQHSEYTTACKDIIGSTISAFGSNNGKKAGKIVDNHSNIPIEQMGDGVANLLGLITNMCVSDKRIFVIEEIENDLHPKALKSLLEIIVKKSANNQFFISTHSNIVAKYLGSLSETKIFNIKLDWSSRIPKSNIESVDGSSSSRTKILEDLGYELSDFDLWKGWIFLEESSAEEIIREWFVKWYTPSMSGKIRTISANGNSNVEPKFDDFNRLFLFTHLEGIYKNRAWVLIDGDPKGNDIIQTLRKRYTASGWHPNQFRVFKKSNFEEYYPNRFSKEISEIKLIGDPKLKRSKKSELLNTIKNWIREDEANAKLEFEQSATEIISVLREIESEIK